MGITSSSPGRIAVIGAGPAGMATALAAHRARFDVTIYERYPEVRPAGNILNLWPPPQKVLALLGVDIGDLGAPGDSQFRRHDGHVRARVRLPQAINDEYGGGFIGCCARGCTAGCSTLSQRGRSATATR
ncbi:MAG: FAD-dependent oxidoreductase [Solirubrobacteraceae bacterium]